MEPSRSTVKRLFAFSGNGCAFPDCNSPIVEDSGTVTGIICHIRAKSKGGPRYDPKQTDEKRHAFDNLMLLCSRHSKLIDSEPKRFTVAKLLKMKYKHEQKDSIELSQSDARKVGLLLEAYRSIYISAGGHVMLNSPGAVQAQSVIIKNQKKKIQILPPNESIASVLSKRNYIQHLIDRYNNFAEKQPGRKFRHAAIYSNIKKDFGAKWDLISLNRFDDLASYLQDKIDRTMLGGMNRGKGISNYSEYEKYRQKYERPPS